MKKIYFFCIKTFLCIILFLIVAIMCKKSQKWNIFIQNEVYGNHISFSSFQNFYNRYLGGIFPLEDISTKNIEQVFNEKLTYEEVITYGEGASLKVSENYLVPVMDNGIVVYKGEKEGYGNVLIIENVDGIDVWYGNMCNFTVNLYDIVKSGDYLGEVCDTTLYLVFTRGNEYLDYSVYLS